MNNIMLYARAVSKVPDPRTSMEYLFERAVNYAMTRAGSNKLKPTRKKAISDIVSSKDVLLPTAKRQVVYFSLHVFSYLCLPTGIPSY